MKRRKERTVIDGTTGKKKKKETIQERNLREYLELQDKVKKWRPEPVREATLPRMKVSEDPNSNFINVKGGYFNKGSKKGCDVSAADLTYLIWVTNNIELNISELNYIRRVIKKKERKNRKKQ